MEIVLLKNTEIGGFKFKKKARIKVTNSLAKQLIADRWARPYPNMIEKIENQLSKIIKPIKQKEK